MINFISYTGQYPTLCMGVLTVEIDGKEYKFGENENTYDFKTNTYKKDCYPQFWMTGGCIRKSKDWDMWTEHAPWEVSGYWDDADEKHPQWIVDLLPKLIKIFNENVPQGCCGGCI